VCSAAFSRAIEEMAYSGPPRPALPRTVLRWLARALLLAALAAALHGWWLRRARARRPAVAPVATLHPKPAAIDWRRERFVRWESPEDGVALEVPERFEAVRGVGRFTSRALVGGLLETDVVAFRSGEPRGVVVVALYDSPRRRSWPEWAAMARADPPQEPQDPGSFASEFGGTARRFAPARQGARAALAIAARGAVRYPARGAEEWEVWEFRSRLVAEGSRAARVTAGLHADHFAACLPVVERVLESFRWSPPATPEAQVRLRGPTPGRGPAATLPPE